MQNKMEQIQTYGKQNILVREYNKVKSYYVVDPLVQQHSPIELYAPGIKRIKLSIGFILVGVCIVTPFTNFMIPSIYKWVVN